MISDIIEILDSWTKHKENAKTQNTKRAGEIGLFFFDKLFNFPERGNNRNNKTVV